MNKYSGYVGLVMDVEERPGIWKQKAIENKQSNKHCC